MEDVIATFALIVVVALAVIIHFGPLAAERLERRRRSKAWH